MNMKQSATVAVAGVGLMMGVCTLVKQATLKTRAAITTDTAVVMAAQVETLKVRYTADTAHFTATIAALSTRSDSLQRALWAARRAAAENPKADSAVTSPDTLRRILKDVVRQCEGYIASVASVAKAADAARQSCEMRADSAEALAATYQRALSLEQTRVGTLRPPHTFEVDFGSATTWLVTAGVVLAFILK